MTEYFFEIIEDNTVIIRGEKTNENIIININESIYNDIEAKQYIKKLINDKNIHPNWEIQIFK